jgi:hypothetical protein
MRLKCISFFLLFLLVSVTICNAQKAQAGKFVADPDPFYEPGASPTVNNAFPGVTLSTNVAPYDVFALGAGDPGQEVYPAAFGHNLINFPTGGCSGCWSFGYAELRADFTRPAKWVAVDFIDRFAGTVIVLAYDSEGSLLTAASANLLGAEPSDAQRVSVQVKTKKPSIAYIVAAAESGVEGIIDLITWQAGGKK